MALNHIDGKVAHEFCNTLSKYNKWCVENGHINGFIHLEEMIKDYSSNTIVKAVLIDLTDRMSDEMR